MAERTKTEKFYKLWISEQDKLLNGYKMTKLKPCKHRH